MATLTQPVRSIDQDALLLDVSHVTLKISPEHFDQLCLDNPDLRLELTKDGNLIVMAPAGGETSRKNLDLAIDVGLWNRQTNLGQALTSPHWAGENYRRMCPGLNSRSWGESK